MKGADGFTVTGLVPGEHYIFKVRAGNEFGWGPYSIDSEAMETLPPDVLTGDISEWEHLDFGPS